MQIEDADVAAMEVMVDHLTQRLAQKKENTLLAVDVIGGGANAVWMRESTDWVKLCAVPDKRHHQGGICVCHVSDGIVISGGCSTPMNIYLEAYPQCYHFSLSTRQWRALNNMRTPRFDAAAAEVEEMMLLVVGGCEGYYQDDDDRDSAVCEWLDIRRGVWTPAACLPKPMMSPLAAAAVGRAYILQQSWTKGTHHFLFVEYDPASDTHTQKTSPPVQGTGDASLVGVADKIYLFGGSQKLSLQYEPATEQWHELVTSPDMVSTWYYPIVRSTDIVLCAGRSRSEEKNRSISYNVKTKQWTVLDFCLPFYYHKTLRLLMSA